MDQVGKMLPTNGDGGAMARAVDDASTRAHGAIDRATSTVAPAVDRMASGAHQAVDRAAQFASGAADTLGTNAARLQDAQIRVTEECRGYVRASPLASVGIALAAGFLLSRLLSSR
jgi:ElaB/YqjD/DUF883 family membrane-anchored ribosome-binding protein